MSRPSRTPYHLDVLQREFEKRRSKNSRYSMREFARALGVDPAALSRILSGKQLVSPKACTKLFQGLHLTAPEREEFLASVFAGRDKAEYRSILEDAMPVAEAEARRLLPRKVYASMADHYHTAVLELLSVQGFRYDVAWIARQLGTTEYHIEWVLSLLIKAGLVIEEGGQLRRALNAEAATFEPRPVSVSRALVLRESDLEIIRIRIEALLDEYVMDKDKDKDKDKALTYLVKLHFSPATPAS